MHNKVKITKKAAWASAPCLLSIHYCAIQTLINHLSPYAYSAGVYGWSCDYYDVSDGIVISTGYRPIGLTVPYDLCAKYEKAAQKAYEKRPWDKAKKYVADVLLPKFVAAAEKAAKK